MKRIVSILVYDDVEILDFAGPFEVFAVASELHGHALFDVGVVAPNSSPVRAVNGLRVLPDYSVAESPVLDVAIVAGGAGSRRAMADATVVEWVRRAYEHAEVMLSVCSGARLLAAAGLLSGLRVVTHHGVVDHLRELAPDADIVVGPRFVDTGRIVTTGGISAGIDGSLHVVERLCGRGVARRTAAYMEYDGWPHRPFTDVGGAVRRLQPD